MASLGHIAVGMAAARPQMTQPSRGAWHPLRAGRLFQCCPMRRCLALHSAWRMRTSGVIVAPHIRSRSRCCWGWSSDSGHGGWTAGDANGAPRCRSARQPRCSRHTHQRRARLRAVLALRSHALFCTLESDSCFSNRPVLLHRVRPDCGLDGICALRASLGVRAVAPTRPRAHFEDGIVVAPSWAACEKIGVRPGVTRADVERLLGPPVDVCWPYTRSGGNGRFRLRMVCLTADRVGGVVRRWSGTT